jgi:hypothetical protein
MKAMVTVKATVDVKLCEGFSQSGYSHTPDYTSWRIEKAKRVKYTMFKEGLLLVNAKVLVVRECQKPENWGLDETAIVERVRKETVKDCLATKKRELADQLKHVKDIEKQIAALSKL